MKNISRAKVILTVNVALHAHLKPINNATIAAALVKHGYENRPPIVEYKINCCDFFRAKRRNFAAMLAYRLMGLEKFSNMNHSCPFNHDLLLDHYTINGLALGKQLPFGAGVYTFDTKWYIYNILRGVVKTRLRILDR